MTQYRMAYTTVTEGSVVIDSSEIEGFEALSTEDKETALQGLAEARRDAGRCLDDSIAVTWETSEVW